MAHADDVIKGVALVETQLTQGLLGANRGPDELLSKLRLAHSRVGQGRVELAGFVVKLTALWDQFGLRREKTASTVAVLLQQQQQHQQQLELTHASKSNNNDKDDVNNNGSNKEKDDITARLQLLEGKVQLMLTTMNHELDLVEKEVGVGEEGLTRGLEELEGVLREVEGVVGVGAVAGGSGKQGGRDSPQDADHDKQDTDHDNGHEEQKQRNVSVPSSIIIPTKSNGSVKSDRAQFNAQPNAAQSNGLSLPQPPAQSPTHYNPPVSPSVASPSLTLTTERSHLTHSTHHQLKREKKAQKLALKNAQKKAEKMKFVHSKRLNRVLGGIIPPGGKESKEDNTGMGAYRVNFERSQVRVCHDLLLMVVVVPISYLYLYFPPACPPRNPPSLTLPYYFIHRYFSYHQLGHGFDPFCLSL